MMRGDRALQHVGHANTMRLKPDRFFGTVHFPGDVMHRQFKANELPQRSKLDFAPRRAIGNAVHRSLPAPG